MSDNVVHSFAEAVSILEAIRSLDEAGNRVIRAGIRKNLITFPSQVPAFEKSTRPDLQAKIAVLYFLRGWSTEQIGRRYGFGRQRSAQILTKWRVRAVRQGYLQLIDETTFATVLFQEGLSGCGVLSDGQAQAEMPQEARKGVTTRLAI